MFRIESDQKQIFYREKPLALSRYEFRILDVMIQHPEQVFSRAQLMTAAWEEPDSSYDRTVDTHIKTLRAKLRKIYPETCCLQTRRGWGYCLKGSE